MKRSQLSGRAGDAVVESLEPRTLLSAATFQGANLYPTGEVVSRTAIADFNGDGAPDIACAVPNAAAIVVLLNNGNGTFRRAPLLPDGDPRAVAAADFFHNGIEDLAVSGVDDRGGGTVEIFTGNGDGTFNRPPTRYHLLGIGPEVYAVDVNGDGWDDIVVATRNRIAVLINLQNGTFAKPVYYSSGNYRPAAIAIGDFNNDGLPDLAVARGSVGGVTILMNNPEDPGTFEPPAYYPTGGSPQDVTVGDFNNDGKLDLAVVNSQFQGNTVAVLIGNGNGTFQAPAFYSGANFSDAIVSADFSGDGYDDLVVGSFDGPLKLYANNGDGTFAPPVTVADGEYTQFLRVADLNNDGLPDLLATPHDGISVILNDTGASTPTPPSSGLTRTIGAGGSRSTSFYTPQGTLVSVSLTGPGSANLDFASSSSISIPVGRNLIPKTALLLSDISATGTTAATSLTITANGGSRTLDLPALSTDGAFGSIAGPRVNLANLSAPGGVARLSLLSANNGTLAVGGGPDPAIQIQQIGSETVASAVPIRSMQVRLSAVVSLTAPSIGTLQIGGSLVNSVLSLTDPYAVGAMNLGRLDVVRGITSSAIYSAGSTGVISARNLTGSVIQAGIAPLPAGQPLPEAPTDFTAPAQIRSISLAYDTRQPSFANSTIAASQIGALNLVTIQTANGGTPFGVGAESIGSLSGTDLTSHHSFVLTRVTSTAAAAAALAAKKINPQDFQIVVS